MPHIFERQQLLRASRSEVFSFFSNAANLEELTPSSLRFEILTPRPIEMRSGTRIDYKLVLFGVPFRWQTLIESFTPETGFVDTQLKGPYKLWRHTHEFVEVEGGTLMKDRVEYEVPFGPLGAVARVMFVARQLKYIFDYRHQAIARRFGSGVDSSIRKQSASTVSEVGAAQ